MQKLLLLIGLLAATHNVDVAAARKSAKVPGPENLGRYYSAYPAPISIWKDLDALFKCEGEYALCAYAVCVPIPDSDPPVAECGCYHFEGTNLGFGPSILKKDLKVKTLKQCAHGAECLTSKANKSAFCKSMNSGRMYPGYDLVSTWNPTSWAAATNQTGDVAPGTYSPKFCTGGTATNCFTAACRRGAPTSQFLAEGAPQYNATCYCPYFTTNEKFMMASEDAPCGSTNPDDIKPDTLIYNGA